MIPDHAGVDEICPSPNHTERRDGLRPDMLILHYTGMGTGEAALRWLCTPESEVSCHYSSTRTGGSCRWCRRTGAPGMRGPATGAAATTSIPRSIGIEIVNVGHGRLPGFPAVQIEAVMRLCAELCRAVGDPARIRAGALGRRSRAKVRSRRKVSLGFNFFPPASVTAVDPAPCGVGATSGSGIGANRSPPTSRCWQPMATACRATEPSTMQRVRRPSPSSGTSARSGSTASPTPRRSKPCTGF